jgi:RimJ/RimL family protein N-acetyltransferase
VVLRLSHDRDGQALVRFGDYPDVAETIWVSIPTPCPRDVAVVWLAEFRNGCEPAMRNRGIATAAAVLVSDWCLEELAAARVELRVGQSNLASQRVAAKAGFSCEGIVHSHVAATGMDYDDLLFVRR